MRMNEKYWNQGAINEKRRKEREYKDVIKYEKIKKVLKIELRRKQMEEIGGRPVTTEEAGGKIIISPPVIVPKKVYTGAINEMMDLFTNAGIKFKEK